MRTFRRTMYYDVSHMAGSRTFSARFSSDVVDRLKRRSDRTQTSRSRLAERYVDEGVRMDEHPGIVFRDGPTGRRAGLAAGPDVWEIVLALKTGSARGDDAVEALSNSLGLSQAQVRVAVRYYAAFADEIDALVLRAIEEADADEQAWKREQAALS